MPLPFPEKAEISPAEARGIIAEGGVLLVDVREPSEFASGRIPGANLVPLGTLQSTAQEWDREQQVLVYCQAGTRGKKACDILSQSGFGRIGNIKGGFSAWTAAGLPGEKSRNAPWSLERQVRFTVGLLVIVFTTLGIGVSHWFLALDFFISAGLIFSAVTNTCSMALVLTKMPWNRGAPTATEPRQGRPRPWKIPKGTPEKVR